MYKYVSSTKMFHVYTAAPRPTQEWSHQPHRKTSASTETNSHQQTPPPRSTPSIHQKLEHTENKHPHIHQCIPPQHTNARIGQRYAEAAHTDKSRGAKSIGQLQSSVALQQHTKPTISGSPSQQTQTSPAQSTEPPPWNPEAPKLTQNIPMVKVPKWS